MGKKWNFTKEQLPAQGWYNSASRETYDWNFYAVLRCRGLSDEQALISIWDTWARDTVRRSRNKRRWLRIVARFKSKTVVRLMSAHKELKSCVW